ncbi:pentapeptide repeat-containing protein [Candidatus Thiosymbion oneisti]|uniref:pentapeptide repeat-containing protein n=1 Tax=Candidatus Thiosymbion oneisti TaxID=589554 RepID=UPI000A810C82|nr:pentapeptide repeat-containing protein [Candidatus Thiosymbion oneisti]
MDTSRDKDLWPLEETDRLAELAVLRTAADEAARHVRVLYFSFLLFAFYVAVIALSTTDEQLLKGTGTKLPLLDIDLPLVEFYVISPLLVLIFHAHLLNQFFLLSRKLFILDRALSSLPSKLERTQRELPFPLVFSHLIVGRHHPRPIQWAFRAAVIVTILLTPIVLLLVIQWKFLPYHSEPITIEHQLVFALDLGLLWFFWPRLSSPSGRWRDWWSQSRSRWGTWVSTILGISASTILVLGAWILLVPHVGDTEKWLAEKWLVRDEGKGLTGNQQGLPWIHRNLVLRERTLMRKAPSVELLFAEHVKTDEERARIWLEAGEALDLSGRDLRYADFYQSDLWDADLRGAKLQHANLDGTKLQGADLRGAQLEGAVLIGAQLEGADLRGAQLQGAVLREARLEGADLSWAQLQGADLTGAQLEGAVLVEAQLEGADLTGAQLEGAVLVEAQLEGADLLWVQLQGADLRGAQLQGAVLFWAQLQGADLTGAQLEGADLRGAQLEGADLREAQLEGADLRGAQLEGADLTGAQLEGADLREAVVYGTRFQDAELSLADLRELRWPRDDWEGLSSVFSEIEKLEAKLEQASEHWSQDERERVERAIERFWSVAFDLPVQPTAISPLQGFEVMHDWRGLFADWPAPPDAAEFEPAHADYRAGLACNDQYIAKGMRRQAKGIRYLGIEGDPVLAEALRARAESGECPELAEVLEKNQ